MSDFTEIDHTIHHYKQRVNECGYLSCSSTCTIEAHNHKYSCCPLSNGRYGIELTFTNYNLINYARDQKIEDYNRVYHELFHSWLIQIRKYTDLGLNFSEITKDQWGFDKITIDLPSKKQLFIHSDDWVIEVGASPYTLNDFNNDHELIQKILFDTAFKVGLYPHYRIGCGHLHLEYKTHFGDNALLFRNFIIDLLNRPNLFLGGLSKDLLNSPVISILSLEQQNELVKIIQEFDALEPKDRSIVNFYTSINKRVYTRSFIKGSGTELEDFNEKQAKYQCINFQHEQTVELRGLRPQANVHSMLSLMKLFESRIDVLKSLTEPIPYAPIDLRDKVSWSVDRNVESYEVKIPAKEIYNTLQEYINDSKVIIIPELIMTDELRGQLDEDAVEPAFEHGTLLGTTKCGVPGYAANYSNFHTMTEKDFKNFIGDVYTGVKYQCVEYARRYWYVKYSCLLRNIPLASDIWQQEWVFRMPMEVDKHVPLKHFENGGYIPPAVGDLLIYETHPEQFTGHVAVVTEVLDNCVRIGEQNRNNGKYWPGDYAFEIPMIISTKVDTTGNVTATHYTLDDRDCKGLLGWTRLLLDQEFDAPRWKARNLIDESKLGVENKFWFTLQKFLDSYPSNIESPLDIYMLQNFLNRQNEKNSEDLIDMSEIDRHNAGFNTRNVSVLQRFLNRYWKLSAPDSAIEKNEPLLLEVNGEWNDLTLYALHRLCLRIATNSEFGFASRHVLE